MATGYGASASSSGSSSGSSWLRGVNDGESWSRNAPSLPARRNGSTVSSVRSAIARSSAGSRTTRPRSVVLAPSRRSGGSESSGAEWRESSRCSLTSKLKSSGVTSAQRATVPGCGSA